MTDDRQVTDHQRNNHRLAMTRKAHLTPRDVASLLPGSESSGDGYISQCPAHKDSPSTLKISVGHKATVLYCHAGCSVTDVLNMIGVRWEQLFYDYRSGTDQDDPRTEMLHVLAQMQERYRPPQVECEYQLADIMWVALVNDRCPDDVWAEAMAQACLETPVMQLEYAEAMTMSVIIGVGPLFTFLRPLWESLGRPNWHTLRNQAFDKMHEVYVEKRRAS